MIDANTILQTVTLGVVAWALGEIISLKTAFSAMNQKMKDLPCNPCPTR